MSNYSLNTNNPNNALHVRMIRVWVTRELFGFVDVLRLFGSFQACAIILHELDVRQNSDTQR